MRTRFLSGLAGLCLLLAAVPARAADPKPINPGLIVRIKPISALMEDARYLADLADKGDDFKITVGDLYKSLLKDKSLEGIDVTRPLGAYAEIAADGISSPAVVLIPIADETTFLNFIKGKDLTPKKDDDGAYTVDIPKSQIGPAYLRFANKYAYVTVLNKDNIAAARLLEPSKVLPAKFNGAVSVTLDVDKLPDELKKMIITQSANYLALQKDEKRPQDTKAVQQLRAAALDEARDWIKLVVNEGGELGLVVDVNRATGDLSASLSLTGKKGTKLAKSFADFGAARSIGASLIGKDSAANFLIHLSLPETLRKAAEPVVDEFSKKAIEEEQDKDKRAVAEKMLKVLAPTFKSGELDLGFNLRGPSPKGLYALVIAAKVKDGAALETSVKDIFSKLPENERKKVKLDFAKVGNTNIHQVMGGEVDEKMKAVFGDGPGYIAMREDALLVALGDGALEAMKEAVQGKPAASKTLQLELSATRLLNLAKLAPPEQRKAAEDAAGKAFAKDKDADKVTLVLEAGDALKLHVNMKAAVVRLLSHYFSQQR